MAGQQPCAQQPCALAAFGYVPDLHRTGGQHRLADAVCCGSRAEQWAQKGKLRRLGDDRFCQDPKISFSESNGTAWPAGSHPASVRGTGLSDARLWDARRRCSQTTWEFPPAP